MRMKLISLMLFVLIVAVVGMSSMAAGCRGECVSNEAQTCTEYYDDVLEANVCRCTPVS